MLKDKMNINWMETTQTYYQSSNDPNIQLPVICRAECYYYFICNIAIGTIYNRVHVHAAVQCTESY